MTERKLSGVLAAAVVSALLTLFAAPQSAVAGVPTAPAGADAPALQAGYPTGWSTRDAGGMTAKFKGVYVSRTRMESIYVELCDTAPYNTNEATAALTVQLRNPTTGAITWETAPARLKVPQGVDCVADTWVLAYPQQIRAVTMYFWGDEAPYDSWRTEPWKYNPYVG